MELPLLRRPANERRSRCNFVALSLVLLILVGAALLKNGQLFSRNLAETRVSAWLPARETEFKGIKFDQPGSAALSRTDLNLAHFPRDVPKIGIEGEFHNKPDKWKAQWFRADGVEACGWKYNLKLATVYWEAGEDGIVRYLEFKADSNCILEMTTMPFPALTSQDDQVYLGCSILAIRRALSATTADANLETLFEAMKVPVPGETPSVCDDLLREILVKWHNGEDHKLCIVKHELNFIMWQGNLGLPMHIYDPANARSEKSWPDLLKGLSNPFRLLQNDNVALQRKLFSIKDPIMRTFVAYMREVWLTEMLEWESTNGDGFTPDVLKLLGEGKNLYQLLPKGIWLGQEADNAFKSEAFKKYREVYGISHYSAYPKKLNYEKIQKSWKCPRNQNIADPDPAAAPSPEDQCWPMFRFETGGGEMLYTIVETRLRSNLKSRDIGGVYQTPTGWNFLMERLERTATVAPPASWTRLIQNWVGSAIALQAWRPEQTDLPRISRAGLLSLYPEEPPKSSAVLPDPIPDLMVPPGPKGPPMISPVLPDSNPDLIVPPEVRPRPMVRPDVRSVMRPEGVPPTSKEISDDKWKVRFQLTSAELKKLDGNLNLDLGAKAELWSIKVDPLLNDVPPGGGTWRIAGMAYGPNLQTIVKIVVRDDFEKAARQVKQSPHPFVIKFMKISRK